MLGAYYGTKKELKAALGKKLRYVETSLLRKEFEKNGSFCVVGPDPKKSRKWYARVVMEKGLIKKVS